MVNLQNLKIGTRLGLGYGLVLLLMVGVAFFGILGMQRSNEAVRHIVEVNLKKITLSVEMADTVNVISRVTRTIAVLDDAKQEEQGLQEIGVANQNYDVAFVAIENMPIRELGLAHLGRLKDLKAAAMVANTKFIEQLKVNKPQALELLFKDAIPKTKLWLDSIHEFIEAQKAISIEDEKRATSTFDESLLLMLILSSAAILAGTLTAWLVTKSITQPINSAVQFAQIVASGDLTSDITIEGRDEAAQLLSALHDMNQSLVNIVGEVRTGAHTISGSSRKIASSNTDLSARTEMQAVSRPACSRLSRLMNLPGCAILPVKQNNSGDYAYENKIIGSPLCPRPRPGQRQSMPRRRQFPRLHCRCDPRPSGMLRGHGDRLGVLCRGPAGCRHVRQRQADRRHACGGTRRRDLHASRRRFHQHSVRFHRRSRPGLSTDLSEPLAKTALRQVLG